MMKTILPLCLFTGMVMLGMVSCKEKKTTDDIYVAKYVPEEPGAPIRSTVDARRTDVKWLNAFYTVSTKREAADSLPKLKDETGQEYFDNRVTLTIQRSDSSVFFHRVFTKQAFLSHIAENFRDKGYLENIIFHDVEDGCLKFGVAVSRPGYEDEYVPLDLFVDRHGNLRIAAGKLFDNTDDEEAEKE